MAPTAADEKLEGMIRDLADKFGKFQIESERRDTAISGEIAALRTKVEGDITVLGTKVGGDIKALRTKVEGDITVLGTKVGGDIKALEMRVERAFGFQRWLAGFLIPISLGLIGTAVTLAYGAGQLDASVKALASRMGGVEEGLKKVNETLQTTTNKAGSASPAVTAPLDRVFDLPLRESIGAQIRMALLNKNGPQGGQPSMDGLSVIVSHKVDAGKKPDWLTAGMHGLVLLDRRLTDDGLVAIQSSGAKYLDDVVLKNTVDYSLSFTVKGSDLEKFRDKMASIGSGDDLPFSVSFARAR